MDENCVVGHVTARPIRATVSLPLGAGNGSGSVLRDVSGTVEAAKNTTHVEAILLGDCGVVLRVVGRRTRWSGKIR